MLNEVFGGTSSRDQDMMNLSLPFHKKTSTLSSQLKTRSLVENRKRTVVMLRALLTSKRDVTIRKCKFFSRWRQSVQEAQVTSIILSSRRQTDEIAKIKQAHLATVQAFANSKSEMENKLVKMAVLI